MFYDNYVKLCNIIGKSPSAIAVELGLKKATVTGWKKGATPTYANLQKIADYFGVTVDFLQRENDNADFNAILKNKDEPGLEQEEVSNLSCFSISGNIIPLPTTKKIPLLGTISCGEPILAMENMEGIINTPEEVPADFALRCKGDSMINARIFDGDIVYIRQQSMVENGEIAAVLIDDEATLKRVKIYSDHISLEPENPQYRPIVYWEDEMNSVKILGKAVAFISAVR